MRNRIVVMLALAVVGGGGSLLAAQTWLDGQASRRLAEIDANRPDVRFDTIVVAAEPLRFGAALAAGNLKTIPWPSGELPPGAFADVETLLRDGPREVLSPMEPFEPVLTAKVTGPGEGAQLSRVLGEGKRAVSIRVDDVVGVAGFLMPGDRVDVVLTRDADGATRGNVILQGVKVLTVDQSADERAEGPQIARAVTVEVDPAGAQKIALGRAIGTLSLVLRPAGEAGAATIAGITADDLVTTTVSAVPAPPVALPAPTPAPAAEPDGTTVWVSRAFQRTSYRVPERGQVLSEPAATPAAPADPAPPASSDAAADRPVASAAATTRLVAETAGSRPEVTDIR